MDWIAFQYRIKKLHDTYFNSRIKDEAHAKAACLLDTGEMVKKIDDAILDLWNTGRREDLTEEEMDVIGVRLNWAWLRSMNESAKAFEKIETPEKSDFVHVLITEWHQFDKSKYHPWIPKALYTIR